MLQRSEVVVASCQRLPFVENPLKLERANLSGFVSFCSHRPTATPHGYRRTIRNHCVIECPTCVSFAAEAWFGTQLCGPGSWRNECETGPQNYTLTTIYCSKLLVLFMTTNSDRCSFTINTVIPTSVLYSTIPAYSVLVSKVFPSTFENIGNGLVVVVNIRDSVPYSGILVLSSRPGLRSFVVLFIPNVHRIKWNWYKNRWKEENKY